MNEEEKQAIDWLKDELDDEKKSHKNCNYSYKGVTGLYGNNEVEIALKLIEKQQKEIEKLEDKNKTLERLLQGDLYEMYKYYRELANSYQANCISKDKIKEKIEEVEKKKEKTEILDFKAFYSIKEIKNIEINILKEILGE